MQLATRKKQLRTRLACYAFWLVLSFLFKNLFWSRTQAPDQHHLGPEWERLSPLAQSAVNEYACLLYVAAQAVGCFLSAFFSITRRGGYAYSQHVTLWNKRIMDLDGH